MGHGFLHQSVPVASVPGIGPVARADAESLRTFFYVGDPRIRILSKQENGGIAKLRHSYRITDANYQPEFRQHCLARVLHLLVEYLGILGIIMY